MADTDTDGTGPDTDTDGPERLVGYTDGKGQIVDDRETTAGTFVYYVNTTDNDAYEAGTDPSTTRDGHHLHPDARLGRHRQRPQPVELRPRRALRRRRLHHRHQGPEGQPVQRGPDRCRRRVPLGHRPRRHRPTPSPRRGRRSRPTPTASSRFRPSPTPTTHRRRRRAPRGHLHPRGPSPERQRLRPDERDPGDLQGLGVGDHLRRGHLGQRSGQRRLHRHRQRWPTTTVASAAVGSTSPTTTAPPATSDFAPQSAAARRRHGDPGPTARSTSSDRRQRQLLGQAARPEGPVERRPRPRRTATAQRARLRGQGRHHRPAGRPRSGRLDRRQRRRQRRAGPDDQLRRSRLRPPRSTSTSTSSSTAWPVRVPRSTSTSRSRTPTSNALTDYPVEVTVDKGFLSPERRDRPSDLTLADGHDATGDLWGFFKQLGQTQNVSTGDAGRGRHRGRHGADADFDDDGLSDMTITVKAGDVTETRTVTFDDRDTAEPAEGEPGARRGRARRATSRVGQDVPFQLYTVDQFGNLAGDQLARITGRLDGGGLHHRRATSTRPCRTSPPRVRASRRSRTPRPCRR